MLQSISYYRITILNISVYEFLITQRQPKNEMSLQESFDVRWRLWNMQTHHQCTWLVSLQLTSVQHSGTAQKTLNSQVHMRWKVPCSAWVRREYHSSCSYTGPTALCLHVVVQTAEASHGFSSKLEYAFYGLTTVTANATLTLARMLQLALNVWSHRLSQLSIKHRLWE